MSVGFLDGEDALYEEGDRVMTCSAGRIGTVRRSHTELGRRLYTIEDESGTLFVAEEEDLISIW
jgi:hypothetical protein